MRRVCQTTFAGDGKGGNCVQASVASILGLPLDAVPHFLEVADRPEEWELALIDWLEARGISTIRREGEWVFEGYYLASGPSTRGVSHMVVYCDGKLAHDPHPSGEGIKSVSRTWVLCPLDPSEIIASRRAASVIRLEMQSFKAGDDGRFADGYAEALAFSLDALAAREVAK